MAAVSVFFLASMSKHCKNLKIYLVNTKQNRLGLAWLDHGHRQVVSVISFHMGFFYLFLFTILREKKS